MGVNPFVEGMPSSVLVSVRLPLDVTTLPELRHAIRALELVDEELHRRWAISFRGTYPSARRARRTELVSMHVASPPILTLLTDPAWIAVFVGILSQYPNMKAGASDIGADAERVLKWFVGLSSHELQLLRISVKMYADSLRELPSSARPKLAALRKQVQLHILGESEWNPEVEVRKLDDWRP
jgi:hypothetical protein